MNIKNILFKKKKNKIDVKVCDFGMANYILEGIFVTLNVGTNVNCIIISSLSKVQKINFRNNIIKRKMKFGH